MPIRVTDGPSNKKMNPIPVIPQDNPIIGLSTTDEPAVTGVNYSGQRAGYFRGDVKVTRNGSFDGDVEVIGKGVFHGDVEVAGNIKLTSETGDVILSDCAEDFDIFEMEKIEPGSVMVINQDGVLQQCQQAYDKRVAGVISGAGNLRPGIILGKQQSQNKRMPVALVGKVYCKVDAQYSPIEVGDLLTTSPTPGHAMKAHDPYHVFGSVIGKALRPLEDGQGLIPILIALQ